MIHICLLTTDMKAVYVNSPHFQDVYLYLLDNKIPCAHQAQNHLNGMSSDYMILDYLPFCIVKDPVTGDYKPLLCIPTSKVDTLLYHIPFFPYGWSHWSD